MTNAANEMGVFERVVERGSFAAAAQDVTLAFNETAPGVYSARIAAPAPGGWIVRGAAKRDGAQRSFERRLQWRP